MEEQRQSAGFSQPRNTDAAQGVVPRRVGFRHFVLVINELDKMGVYVGHEGGAQRTTLDAIRHVLRKVSNLFYPPLRAVAGARFQQQTQIMYKTFIREQELDGVGNWVWPEGDLGLWQGPSEEWPVFKALFLKHLRNRRVCVQAGGGAGVYPRLLANVFERVYTFEPEGLNFYCLVNNCRDVDNVFFYNSALGEFHGDVSFLKSHPTNVGMHRVVNTNVADAHKVHQMRVDDFDFQDVDFLMLDIEHYEYYALKGGLVTILKNKPLIQLENAEYQEIWQLMSQIEYIKVEQHNSDSLWKYKYHC